MTKSFLNYAAYVWAFILMASQPSHAGMFDSLPGAANVAGGIGGASTASAMSAEDLNTNLSGLQGRFARALTEMLTAQSITADALGDKARADILASEAKGLEGKMDVNTIERKIQVSEAAAKENESKMAASATLGAEAKAKLGTAATHYAVGVVQGAHLPGEYASWVQQAQATVGSMQSNPTQVASAGSLATKVSEVAGVSAKLPDLISAWGSSTKAFVTFAKGNDVDTGDLSDKI